MRSGRFAFVRTTTFRLALVYAVLFALFSAGLISYLFQATVVSIRAEAKSQLEAELRTLAIARQTGGAVRLEQSLIERALVRVRDFTYQFETATGERIVGDMPGMPVEAPDEVGEVRVVHFELEMPQVDGSPIITPIEGRIVRMEDGTVLLVGIEMDQRLRIVGQITRAVATAAPIGILLALLGGFFSARYAARRAETLTTITDAVMSGDLTQRVPVVGSGDEFDRLAEQLNAMLARIENLISATRHAGDAIAHDLRSPLSRLRNRIEGALIGPIDEVTARETLGITVEEIDHILLTFDGILRLSRLSAGAEGKLARLNLSDLASEISELFEPACEDAGLLFSEAIADRVHVMGDKTLLAQALSNVLDNAVKYSPPGGQIVLKLKAQSGRASLSVADTGPGIPVEDRTRVIERFVRLDDARTKQGSGLGLSLVDAVADLHSGTLSLQSGDGDSENPGLKVIMSLPAMD
ncbi:MAG: HAMP domain-containing sensor histidine kinase [Pseudomonadota bacterium]